MNYKEIYQNNKEFLLKAVKDSGYTLEDLKAVSNDMSLMQILIELFI